MPRRTNPFQQLVNSIMAIKTMDQGVCVEESVLETSPAGTPREIDIRVSGGADGTKMLIECRAHGRPQTVQWIDELAGKANSLGYERVVAVSSSGFTKAAEKEAVSRGIEPIHLKEADGRDWHQWVFGLEEFHFTLSGYPLVERVQIGFVDPALARQYPQITAAKPTEIRLRDTANGKEILLHRFLQDQLRTPEILASAQQSLRDNVQKMKPGQHCWTWVKFKFDSTKELVLREPRIVLPVKAVRVFFRLVDVTEVLKTQHFSFGEDRIYVARSKAFPTRKYIAHEKPGKLVLLIEEMVADR
jgi:hypothetical protein